MSSIRYFSGYLPAPQQKTKPGNLAFAGQIHSFVSFDALIQEWKKLPWAKLTDCSIEFSDNAVRKFMERDPDNFLKMLKVGAIVTEDQRFIGTLPLAISVLGYNIDNKVETQQLAQAMLNSKSFDSSKCPMLKKLLEGLRSDKLYPQYTRMLSVK